MIESQAQTGTETLGLFEPQHLNLRMLFGERFAPSHGFVGTAVVNDDQLEGPVEFGERVEPRLNRFFQDRRLVPNR